MKVMKINNHGNTKSNNKNNVNFKAKLVCLNEIFPSKFYKSLGDVAEKIGEEGDEIIMQHKIVKKLLTRKKRLTIDLFYRKKR